MKKLLRLLLPALMTVLVSSCGIYSFTGTSIQPDVYTITINYFKSKNKEISFNKCISY